MEAKKEFRAVLKRSDNVFQDILSPLAARGAVPYTYFYRIVGCDHEERYLQEIADLDKKLRAVGNYFFIDRGIEVAKDSAAIEALRTLMDQVPRKDYSNGALLNILEAKGYFTLLVDVQAKQRNKAAFGRVLQLYVANEGEQVNLSMLRNFATKVLLWFVDYGKQMEQRSAYNPKFLYWGSPKVHEVYFLILMSLVGCDVLVLNTSWEDQFEKVDQENQFSFLLKKERARPVSDFPGQEARREPAKASVEKATRHSRPEIKDGLSEKRTTGTKPGTPGAVLKARSLQELRDSFDPCIVVKLKMTDSPLQDVLLPLDKRSGYIGGQYPILPAFFVRYIGAPDSQDDWEAEYYNSLYNLDKALIASYRYLKFLTGVPAASPAENSRIPQEFTGFAFRDGAEITERILQAGLLPVLNDPLWNNTLGKAFVDTVSLFVEKNSAANPSVILNFSLKLVGWLNRYLPKLLADWNRRPASGETGFSWEANPKVLFYGTAKAHEIYLLRTFHQLGCDVLFIHSAQEGDQPFQRFDAGGTMTQGILNQHSLALTSFPEGERLVRKSTVAYQASKEIEEVIYGEEVGLFKPWQFEGYATQPVTLKTTWDELKILWSQPAKLRPEFKIQNKKVYVPNLFAKVNGVSEELSAYWQDFKGFLTASHTKLLEDVPFTKISYTKQELFQNVYLLNKNGFFDEQKVRQSPHYRFGYLKAPLQNFLIQKINELLAAEMFLAPLDDKFKLKVIMTILTMEDSLLKLIEVFDFPQEIPKVLVFDNEKTNFSEDDAILLAYFNLIGLDVVIFTPTNYMTIEHQIKPSLFEVHQLPLVRYELQLPDFRRVAAPQEERQRTGLFARFFKLN